MHCQVKEKYNKSQCVSKKTILCFQVMSSLKKQTNEMTFCVSKTVSNKIVSTE